MLKDILRNGDSIVVPGFPMMHCLRYWRLKQDLKPFIFRDLVWPEVFLGKPDVGLVTAEQMVNTIGHVVEGCEGIRQ
ncbi:MAG: hypothetical protein CM1200mP40_01990 [Gammaproteobacteria bacterium]|nr:MAG: hypothetical protein CM1200mP40_01990 [Gammaproteobacteria bacterium]